MDDDVVPRPARGSHDRPLDRNHARSSLHDDGYTFFDDRRARQLQLRSTKRADDVCRCPQPVHVFVRSHISESTGH
jgi:hypothetical protein